MQQKYSLVLVHTPEWQDVADFEKIRDGVQSIADDIDVFIVDNLSRASTTRKWAARNPSLVFSPIRLLDFEPLRGRIYQGRQMTKLAELKSLVAHGLPVPHYEPLEPDTLLDPDAYGEWVVLKPVHDLASWGEGIELSRTANVRFRGKDDYPEGHPARKAGVYAQAYIDCGHAMTARILTLFGEPIFTYLRTAKAPLDLANLQEPFRQQDFMPVDGELEIARIHDQDMFDLARRAYQAMPDVALQACDILRDSEGGLHLLEVNPGGGTWMFSSRFAPAYRKSLGVADLATEFDAFNTCARLLVERTRQEAC